MEYTIGRRGGRGALKKFPWFKDAMKMQLLLPMVPLPVLMKRAERKWKQKNPGVDPANPTAEVSGIIPGIDFKSILIGIGLGVAFGNEVKQAFSGRKSRR